MDYKDWTKEKIQEYGIICVVLGLLLGVTGTILVNFLWNNYI